MAIKINGSNISQMKINGYDIKLAKINGSIVFEKVKLVKTFYGDSIQTSTTGKNLFDYNYYFDNYINNGNEYGIYPCLLTLTPNTQYIVSTNNNRTDVSGGIFANVFAWGGSDTSVTPGTSGQGVMINYPRTITTDNNGNLIIAIRTSEVSKSHFEDGTVWVQIEEGSTATEYEPYTGGIASPNPDYPQEVKSIVSANLKLVGKNMLPIELNGQTQTKNGLTLTCYEDGNLVLNGSNSAYTEFYLCGDWNSTKTLFQFKAGITYSSLITHDDAVLHIVSNASIKWSLTYNANYTPQEDINVTAVILALNNNSTFNNLTIPPMIFEGTFANKPEYEPYKTGTIPINLQGNILSKVGDYADELQIYSNGDVKLVKKTREYTVTGQEDFTNTWGTNLFDCQTLFDDKPFIAGSGLSNYYRYISAQQGVSNVMVHGDFVLQNAYYPTNNLFIKDTNYDNATNFKNHLAELYSAGTPVKVYYPLLNPTTIQLPNIKSDLDDFGEYSSMDIEVTYG